MGLLDAEMFTPSEQDKTSARNAALLAAGLGILANNRGRFGEAVGQGGLTGLATYQSALQGQQEEAMRRIKMQQMQEQLNANMQKQAMQAKGIDLANNLIARFSQPQPAQMQIPSPANMAPVSAGSASDPRGLRNNNPGNIVKTSGMWAGEVPGNDSRFKAFASPEAGIAAIGKNLQAYSDKHGLNTISGIINRWAPSNENNTSAYINAVAKETGLDPNAPLNLKDQATAGKLVGAIIRHENGRNPFSQEQIMAAMSGTTVPPQQSQPQTMGQSDLNNLVATSAALQLAGVDGASGLAKMAEFMKPDIKYQDVGAYISVRDGFGREVGRVEKGMSPEAAASTSLAKARFEFDKENAKKPPAGFRYSANGDLEPIPGGPADAKKQAQDQMKVSGASDVAVSLNTLRDAYNRLEKGGGITSTENNALSNLAASSSSSDTGQVFGRMFGTANQSARNEIAMARPALLGALMKATGMSAKQMDSNAELKLWLATATDPTLDVQANRKALENIENKYLKPLGMTADGGKSQDGKAATQQAQQPVKIKGNDDYNSLPSGAEFIDPMGKRRRKP